MGEKGPFHVRFAEDENVLLRVELHGAPEVRFVHFAMFLGSPEFYTLRIHRKAGAAPSDADNPGKTSVNQEGGFLLVGQQPNELDKAFSPAFDETYFLRTGQLFVARQPMQCVAKRPRVERGDGNRIVALHTCFGPKFESDGGVPADFKDSPVQREHLLGCKQDLFLVKQSQRKSRLPEHNHRGKAQLFESSWQGAGNSKSVVHSCLAST